MRGLHWIRRAAFALVLLLAAPAAEPQGIIANVCRVRLVSPAAGDHRADHEAVSVLHHRRPARRWTHALVRLIYLNPHAPPPQRPTVTP
jgi:hypothetical protein